MNVIDSRYWVLPTHHCEDEISDYEREVLDFIKMQAKETGIAVHVSVLINKFGKFHRVLKQKTWSTKPLNELVDHGALALVPFKTPAFVH